MVRGKSFWVSLVGSALLLGVACQAQPESDSQQPATDIGQRELRILQWNHFVPRYDEWFDSFAQEWGEANDVNVVVEHVKVTDLGGQIAAELAAGQGHDLMEHVVPPSSFEPHLLDLTDVNLEANRRFGDQVSICERSSLNPHTGKYYGFCHGWVPDPGDYRKSLWVTTGMEEGPSTWDDLLSYGAKIRQEVTVPMGIGLSNEMDSNMAGRDLLWSYGASIQDEDENVTINSPESVLAVEYMVDLYRNAMTDDIFDWEPASNNKALVAADASYILNSISAYRTAQKTIPEVADDVFFTPALVGPDGIQLASAHVFNVYIIPRYSPNAEAAKKFLLDFTAIYDQAVYNSELYNFPAFPSTAPQLFEEGGWLDADPFGSNPSNKLSLLKGAEAWSTNLGYPGPANAAVGEVFGASIIPQMFAKAARGEMTPEESVAWAETQIDPIFEKWRALGLVGGAD